MARSQANGVSARRLREMINCALRPATDEEAAMERAGPQVRSTLDRVPRRMRA